MADFPSPDLVALARLLYAQGLPVKAILLRTGLKLGVFYRCLGGHYPDGSEAQPAPMALRRPSVRARQRIGSRAALVARMWSTAEAQVEEIEARLRTAGLELAERESNARTLAIVARTLRELSAVDQDKKKRGKEAAKADDDDAVPRNIEDLREALARKLEAFVAREQGQVPDDPE